MAIHSYRKVQNAEGEDVYQVGLASGNDVLDPRQFVPLAEYDNPGEAAAFAAYLNGGAPPTVTPGSEEAADSESHAKRGRHR